jgi:ATP-dependent Clp protease ATP-binding subunit ClpC
MVNALSGTLKRAKELAHKRRQAPSTAHVFVALYHGDAEVREVCLGLSLTEAALLRALDHIYEERTNAIDLSLERARKLAAALGVADVAALHVVLALAREQRCAASSMLQFLGIDPEHTSTACVAWLEASARAASEAPALRATERPGANSVQLALWKSSGRGKRLEAEAFAATSSTEPTPDSASAPRALHRHKRIQDGRRRALLAAETESKLQRRPSSPDGAGPRDGYPDSASAEDFAEPTTGNLAGAQLRDAAPSRSNADARRDYARSEDIGAQLRDGSPDRADNDARAAPARGTAERRPSAPVRPLPADTFVLDPERFPLLAGLGHNLTALAAAGHLDPVVGRDKDVQRTLDVLARRRANNPILVGAPGVGKTAIAHGLAHVFVRAALEQPSAARVLVELSTSSLLSGTGVRGALSERVQQLRAEVAEAKGRVLLFVDEVHSLLGGGEADSLANELKTALARGELPLLGATTDTEYRRVFERDAALARRFTRIEIAEPNQTDTLEILRSIAPQYAQHHGVRYEPAALQAAVELSARYLPLRQLPDKAIALLDQAGARAQRHGSSVVDVHGVASVVSELAAVPVDRLLMQDADALLSLEQALAGRVVGQSAAISSIANALRKSAAGFRGARPLGTFLFTGPTGVGKTELARAISEVLFPGVPWTRIDMSELSQAHGVARLLGAPPGYLGHDEGGQLTEAVRNRPYQLVLLDEIEKAHIEVLLALLPLLDEGRMTDGRGRTVDFTNTVVVMTSNLGAECASARNRIGFDAEQASDSDGARDRALAAVRAALPPELYNRIEEALYFAPLRREDVAEIARRMLAALVQVALERHAIDVEFESSAIDALIAAGGFDPTLGARPMRRTIGRLVEAPLARAVLAREITAGARIVLRGSGSRVLLVPDAKLARAAR